MCLIGVAWKAHPDFPLIVAANRDEYHARPTAPSAWWHDVPQLFAGRDLQSGGAWMGITRSGRFAALTNLRDPGDTVRNAPSRGTLVAEFLRGTATPGDYLASLIDSAARYAGFNLLTGSPEQLWYAGNRGALPQALQPGIYGLSNALLNTPWPKVISVKAALGAALAGMVSEDPLLSRVSGMVPVLFKALGDARPAAAVHLPRRSPACASGSRDDRPRRCACRRALCGT